MGREGTCLSGRRDALATSSVQVKGREYCVVSLERHFRVNGLAYRIKYIMDVNNVTSSVQVIAFQ